MGWLSLIVFYVLILLKTHSTLHLKHTHQHPSKHTTWHFIPIPNIHLSWKTYENQHTSTVNINHHKSQHVPIKCISSHMASYHGQGRTQAWQQASIHHIQVANKSWQKGRHGNKVLIIKYIPNFQTWKQASNKHIHLQNVCS